MGFHNADSITDIGDGSIPSCPNNDVNVPNVGLG